MIRGQEKSGRDYSTQNVKGKGRQLLLNHNNHRYTEIIKSKQQRINNPYRSLVYETLDSKEYAL